MIGKLWPKYLDMYDEFQNRLYTMKVLYKNEQKEESKIDYVVDEATPTVF